MTGHSKRHDVATRRFKLSEHAHLEIEQDGLTSIEKPSLYREGYGAVVLDAEEMAALKRVLLDADTPEVNVT